MMVVLHWRETEFEHCKTAQVGNGGALEPGSSLLMKLRKSVSVLMRLCDSVLVRSCDELLSVMGQPLVNSVQ